MQMVFTLSLHQNILKKNTIHFKKEKKITIIFLSTTVSALCTIPYEEIEIHTNTRTKYKLRMIASQNLLID